MTRVQKVIGVRLFQTWPELLARNIVSLSSFHARAMKEFGGALSHPVNYLPHILLSSLSQLAWEHTPDATVGGALAVHVQQCKAMYVAGKH